MELSFDPADASFNRANALYLAHAADVAYNRAPKRGAAVRLGLDAVPFRSKLTRTRGFLGVCETHAVLSFRGSDPLTLPNWMTDVVVQLVERDDYTGRVHLGFSSVLKRTWGKVEKVLEQTGDRPLFLTGHSMGGALAVLTAIRLAKLGRPAVATYTFGSPRFADVDFCAAHKLPTYRVVNRRSHDQQLHPRVGRKNRQEADRRPPPGNTARRTAHDPAGRLIRLPPRARQPRR